MTAKAVLVEEFSFAGEEIATNACSKVLRKVTTLAESAPIGRLFASIATLSEVSHDVSKALAANNLSAANAKLRAYADQDLTAGMAMPKAGRAR